MLGFEVLAIALASQRRSANLTRALGLAVWFLACAAARRLTAVPFSLGDHACITLLALASWLPAEPRLRATPRARFWIGAGLALVAAFIVPWTLPLAGCLVWALRSELGVGRAPRFEHAALGILGAAAFAAVLATMPRSVELLRQAWVPSADPKQETLAFLAHASMIALLSTATFETWRGRRRVGAGRAAMFWIALGVELGLVALSKGADSRALWALPLCLVFAVLFTPEAETKRPPSFAIVATALSLAAAGGLLPVRRGESELLARAERHARTFGAEDAIVLRDGPSFELAFYALVASSSLTDIVQKSPGKDPLSALESLRRRVQGRGGRLWLEVDGEGLPVASADAKAPLGASDLARAVMGVTVMAGERPVREVLRFASAAPCAGLPTLALSKGGRVSASGFVEAERSRDYAPERALDGDAKSEWLAPTGEAPWLDVELPGPRQVKGLRIQAARNAPWLDFDTRRVRVELHRKGGRSVSREIDLGLGQSRDLALAASDVWCVRVLILEHRGRGGGIAELELR